MISVLVSHGELAGLLLVAGRQLVLDAGHQVVIVGTADRPLNNIQPPGRVQTDLDKHRCVIFLFFCIQSPGYTTTSHTLICGGLFSIFLCSRRWRKKEVPHFAFELFDVLKHRLQALVGVGHLGVVLGHVVLSELLSLQRHRGRQAQSYSSKQAWQEQLIEACDNLFPVFHITSSLSRSSLSVGGIPGCFAFSSSIKLWVAWSLYFYGNKRKQQSN